MPVRGGTPFPRAGGRGSGRLGSTSTGERGIGSTNGVVVRAVACAATVGGTPRASTATAPAGSSRARAKNAASMGAYARLRGCSVISHLLGSRVAGRRRPHIHSVPRGRTAPRRAPTVRPPFRPGVLRWGHRDGTPSGPRADDGVGGDDGRGGGKRLR